MSDRSLDADDAENLRAVRTTYDAIADDYDASFRDELNRKPLDRALLRTLAELAADGTLADVGCGPGHVTEFLAAHHGDVLGLDLSPAMVDLARARRPQHRFTVADMRRLPAEDGAWTGIAALYSIIHLTERQREQAFAEFRRVLREGGWLLLAFHVDDPDHRPGDPTHLSTWFDRTVDIDAYFLEPDGIVDQLRAADLHVTARLLRKPNPEIEIPSRRGYLLARAGRPREGRVETS